MRVERTAGPAAWATVLIRRPQERLRLALAGLAMAATAVLVASAPAADAAACPNEALRTGPSASLPDCRAYEMVSPPDMNGNGLFFAFAIRDDGDAVGYSTINAFGSEAASSITGQWLAHRDAAGWGSVSINPPTLGRVPSPYDQPVPLGVARDLSSVLYGTRYPFDLRDQTPFLNLSQPGNGDLYRFAPGPSAEWISHGPNLPETTSFDRAFGGASADSSRVFFETKEPLTAAAAGSTAANLYERHGAELASVNVDAAGTLIPGGAGVGRGNGTAAAFYAKGEFANGNNNQGHATDQTAVSADGRVVYFSAPLEPSSAPRQIYARVAGATTVAVSRCQFGPCAGEGAPAGATFLAATPDGGSVIFSSASRLLEAAPESGGFYRFDLATRSLSFLTPFEGDRLYAATSDLATLYLCGVNGLSVLQAGVRRLVAPIPCNSMGTTRNGEPRITPSTGFLFVTTAGPDDIATGEAQVALGRQLIVEGEEQVANGETARGEGTISRGNREVTSGERRIAAGTMFGGYDNAGFAEVYLYEPASGAFRCLSCRPDGSAAEADSSLSEGISPGRVDPSREGVDMRNLSEDGRRAAFASRDALVPADTNGTIDVYQWELAGTGSCSAASPSYSARSGGCVFLISSGTDAGGAALEGMSADGEDIFFSSEVSLVAANTGTELQLYDARVGGGIAAQQATVEQSCEGAGCRSLPPAPPAPAQATTDSFSGAGNAKPQRRCAKPRKHRKKWRHHGRRRGAHHRAVRASSQRAAKPDGKRAAKPHRKKKKKARQARCGAGAKQRAGK